MPEIATETTSLPSFTSTSENRAVIEAVSELTLAPSSGLDAKDAGSLRSDAPPFVPRSVITENKLLAAFKSQTQLSSSDFDSGCDTSTKPNSTRSESEDIPFVKPDEELTKRIVDQVEFYFSDENIVKDAFLLKHVKRNKEGFVSLISSFKLIHVFLVFQVEFYFSDENIVKDAFLLKHVKRNKEGFVKAHF
ncbi:hypothetical protein WDU94_000053 [Cyamophila willieti]